MLPSTLQFVIAVIASAFNEWMQRNLDYTQEEVRVLKEMLQGSLALGGSTSRPTNAVACSPHELP